MKKNMEPAPAITFTQNVMMPPESPGEMSRLIFAGTASPWCRIEDVPERLRDLVGMPPQPNYDVEAFRAETRMIQEQLEPENEGVRRALESIDNEAFEMAKARTETVIRQTPKGTYDD